MADLEILNIAAGLGIGGVLAVLVIIWKRADDKRYTTTLEEITKRLLDVIASNTKAISENTSAIQAISTLKDVEDRLKAMEERLERRRGTHEQ